MLSLAVAACNAPSTRVSQRDLSAYMSQLAQWAPQEAEVGRAVRRILETQFVDEVEVRRQIAESTPRVDAQLDRLRAYQPRSKELQDVHRAYLRAWEGLRTGYSDILLGFDQQSQAALGRGRAALLAWREALPETARRLREIRDALGAAPGNETGPPT